MELKRRFPGRASRTHLQSRSDRSSFISRQVASDFQTGIPPKATITRNSPHNGSTTERQTRYIVHNLRITLEAAGSSLEQGVPFTLCHTHAQEFHTASQVLQ